MSNYKHTSFCAASILKEYLPTIPGMVEIYDLSTKGGRIAYAIEQSGYVPGSIARQLHCKPSAVYQWIDGRTKNLKEHLLWKLADITGFEARWISQGTGPMKLDYGIKHAEQLLMAMEPGARYTALRLIDTLSNPVENKSQ